MSIFKKRRKRIRLKQSEDQKRFKENSKKQDESINNMIETFNIIEKDYPEFKTLGPEDRVKFFTKIFNKVQNKLI